MHFKQIPAAHYLTFLLITWKNGNTEVGRQMGKQQKAQTTDIKQIAGSWFEPILFFQYVNVESYIWKRKGDHPLKQSVSHCPAMGQKKKAVNKPSLTQHLQPKFVGEATFLSHFCPLLISRLQGSGQSRSKTWKEARAARLDCYYVNPNFGDSRWEHKRV